MRAVSLVVAARMAGLAGLVAGCFDPRPLAGLPCAADGTCPTGQTCDPSATPPVCRFPTDAAGAADAAPDDAARRPDARPDAPPGTPDAALAVVGCSDGAREGFVDLTAYPTIAGCAATWADLASLRAAPSGEACGDGLGTCAAPADACAPAWHLCAQDGAIADLADRIGADDCATGAGAGAFVAATSHCASNVDGECTYAPVLPCFDGGWCAEPVCCGGACAGGPSCTDGVWPAATNSNVDNGPGCNATPADAQTGVLCCRDP